MRFAAFLALLALLATSCGTSAQVSPFPASTEVSVEYDRSEWGRWMDEDGDCQDTRQEVLIRQSEVPVTFKDGRECDVESGRWTCPYTGQVYTNPSDLDIDHVVALRAAHSAGGWSWSREEKRTYFNDLSEGHLVAVSASSNRSKGARSPEEWMPPDGRHACRYLKDWLSVKRRWSLEVGCEEAGFLSARMSQVCGD